MSASGVSRLLAADSFRVRVNPITGAAEARGAHAHLARFVEAVREALHGNDTPSSRQAERRTAAQVAEFAREAAVRIAEFGEGWPRLELWGAADRPHTQPDLRLSLRPLPELHDTIKLRTFGEFHTEWPERKGPNIAEYAAMNRELAAEAVLLDDGGRVREGTTTSVLWWNNDRLHRVAYGARVQSITEVLVTETALADYTAAPTGSPSGGTHHRAPASRVTVSPGVTLAELASHEVWAVNALHGIRLVTSIDGVDAPAADLARLRWFRDRLDQSWQPIETMVGPAD